MLLRLVYKDNVVAVVVDEVHCVHSWGNEFFVLLFPKFETYEVSSHLASIFLC